MRLIINGLNGNYLREITDKYADATEEVLAAVAYAKNADLLFNWCWNNKIPLTYYGRLDEGIAVNINILKDFLKKKSPIYTCKLVQHHHAKVIWWRGVGMYIGSANLTNSAWYNNVEAGCFFAEEEIDDMLASDIDLLFTTLEDKSTPLTDELLNVMEKRSQDLKNSTPDATDFWNSPSINKWPGLTRIEAKKPNDRKRDIFLEEWHATLQELRNIGQQVSQEENRPSWVDSNAPAGAQADQFLNAHYYKCTFEGKKANYKHFFEKNKSRRADALSEAIEWWRNLPEAPDKEAEMLNTDAPFLRSALSGKALLKMTQSTLYEICMRVHAIREYARRVRNKIVYLPSDGTQYSISQKVDALAKRIWHDQSSNGERVKKLLKYILYDGPEDKLPTRLWEGVMDPKWKIDGLGISSLGEIVGWTLPDSFPPRNGRTSKALKSLGYNVIVHV